MPRHPRRSRTWTDAVRDTATATAGAAAFAGLTYLLAHLSLHWH
ncbi:hypothetical protein EDD99_8109 [Streptomyces sp. 846.5]|nr:hypothetical protein [Streptomyces sp. 846.5]TDT93300.1 hypothetical protein EDD99_8109 [Streptomyces sp. 846.5]